MTNGNKPFDMRNEMPGEKPNEMPGEMPDEKPDEKPNEMPDEKPNEMPGEKPNEMPSGLNGIILDEQTFLTLTEISQACAVQADYIVELVEEGLITPLITPEAGPESRDPYSWRFTGMHMRHARIALHLQGDLV